MIYMAFLVGVLLGSLGSIVVLPIYQDWAQSKAVDDSPEVRAFMAAFPGQDRGK